MGATKSAVIITSVGLVIGVAEALLYYNHGKHAGGEFHYTFPPKKEFKQLIGMVLVSSVITAGISSLLEYAFTPKEEKKKNSA